MKVETKSTILLICATAIWGWTFILVQQATKFVSPDSFVFMRMVLAAVFFIPLVVKRLKFTTSTILIAGILLASLNATTYILQTEGLQTISASRSAFITGFGVILVPLLSPLFGLGFPKKIEILSAFACFVGLYILTGANITHLSVGDLWSLGCASTYAVMVVCLQIFSKRIHDSLLLSFYMTFFGFIVPSLGLQHFHLESFFHWQVIYALVFCAILATALVTFLMAKYQKNITVAKAAVIYALEPVFATLFAVVFYQQGVKASTLTGGAIMLVSIILPNIKEMRFYNFKIKSYRKA